MDRVSEPAVDAEAPRFDPRRRRAVTLALVLVTSLAAFESTVVSTAMPTIIGDLNGLPVYSWVFSLYLLAATVSMPLYGRLADIHGRRRILLVAIVLFLAGAAACAAARSMTQLILARGLQGLGAGGLVPIALVVSADLYSIRDRARVQGVFSSVWGVSSLVGPLLGAGMTMAFGWRSIFSINLPLGLLAFVLVTRNMRESRAPLPDPFDRRGAALLATGVTALLFSVLQGGSESLGLGVRSGLLVLAVLSLAALVRRQAESAHPLLPTVLFARAETAAPYAGGVLLGTTIFGVDTFVPLFVQGARGGTAAAAGAVVTPLMLLWAASATVAARAIVAFGFRRTARVGGLLILAGFVALIAAAAADAGVAWISGACALIGAGLGPSSLAQLLAIQHAAREKERGVATSLVPFFRTVGGSIGVGALGGILSARLVARLGPAAETAGRLLAHRPGAATVAASSALRQAIEASLLPVFGVLLGLAVVNLVVTSWFPGAVERPAPSPESGTPTHDVRGAADSAPSELSAHD
jgi:MFS family permease